MDDLKTYPVKSRLRHNGEPFGPGTNRETVDMTEEQAATLLGLGILGEPQRPVRGGRVPLGREVR